MSCETRTVADPVDVRGHVSRLRRTKRAAGIWLASAAFTGLAVAVSAAGRDSALADAVERRDAAAVGKLLSSRVDVNGAQPDGATALHWAVHWDDHELARRLVTAGADVNRATDLGVVPLTLACQNASAVMVEHLLAAGANPEAVLPGGERPLMTCARSGAAEAVARLLARGADPNARSTDDRGQTALMWAAAEGHADVVSRLLAGGADVNARSTTGFTPLQFAARRGDVASARALVAAGADIEARSGDGSQALLIAAASVDAIAASDYHLVTSPSDHEALALSLLEQGASPDAADTLGMTPLHAAVQTDKTALLRALIARGAEVNARLAEGLPFRRGDYVSRAYFAGATPFWLASKDGKVDVMRLLAAAGADTNRASQNGTTPLMVAAGLGQTDSRTPPEPRLLEAVKLAHDLGGDVRARSRSDQTALHGAAGISGHSIIRYLVSQGADVNAADRSGRTPFDVTRFQNRPRPETGQLLIELGARPPDRR